jgi:hypothetical protein
MDWIKYFLAIFLMFMIMLVAYRLLSLISYSF